MTGIRPNLVCARPPSPANEELLAFDLLSRVINFLFLRNLINLFIMKLSISASALAVLASLVQAAPANDGSDGCSQLAQSMPEQLSNLTVYASQSYP